MPESKSGLWNVFSFLVKGVDVLSRLALSFVLLVFAVLVLALLASGGGAPEVPDSTVLVVAPRGPIVEQLSLDPTQRLLQQLTGSEEPETLLKDLLDAVAKAKDDDRVKAVLVDTDSLAPSGLTKLQELRAALVDFRQSGKPVIASADNYDQNGYYLATGADEIYLHDFGMLLLEGYGRYRSYFKEGLDRLEIDVNVFKVGEYKSAVEPFLRDGMSDEAREANLEWLGDLWRTWKEDVASARGLEVADLDAYLEGFGERLHEAGGQAAEVAQAAGLVDHVVSRDAVRDRLIELAGEDTSKHSYNAIGTKNYLKAAGRPGPRTSGDGVAVVVAKGTILDGSQPSGTIGGDSTAALIREARKDDKAKAIVLRVDSGGGSAFASEVIREELKLARAAGKPVVVSMGSVAASGGYWISTASDEIWASPTTITGSIGIFGMFPTYQKPLAKYLGTRVDGVGTAPLAGALRPDRELPEEVGTIIQELIDQGYREFLARVSEARDMPVEEVDKIARGRVWSGMDAYEKGLVDQLGGLSDAIASAAEKAGLEEGYAVRYVKKKLDFKEKLVMDLMSWAAERFAPVAEHASAPSMGERFFRSLADEAKMLSRFNDPNGVYAHCLCEID